MTTKTIATINLKGGVAKTTTTVGLAYVLSIVHKKKVLVVDLDPQTNATVMLIGDTKWGELNNKGYTLATLFSDAINGEHTFDLSKTLQKSVGDIRDAKSIDLLPSSLLLIDLQDNLVRMPAGQFGMRNPITILSMGIVDILRNYDYVLIDCPPNLGNITLNGLRISDGYIIPTIPNVMSTYGIPQIVTRINMFSNEIRADKVRSIVPLGIVATKYRIQASHDVMLNLMRNKSGKKMENSALPHPKVFKTYFPENVGMERAAEFQNSDSRTFRQKWGFSEYDGPFKAFADEFITACEEI